MANTYSAGIVTAYGAAKKAGYTGTYEEFCAEQASFARNAQQVRQDKESVEQTVETFSKTTVPAAVQSVTDEGTAQVERVTNVGTTAVGNVNDAGTTQVGNVNNAGTTQVGNVNSAGTTQVGNVNEAGTNQVNAVNTAGATQVQAVENKGAEVLDSIPQDYSDLVDDVADLTRQLSELTDLIPNTVQTIAYASDGSVQSVTHTRNGTAVRTDVFTFGDDQITEVRTLSTGESLTIVTVLSTLVTTISYSEGE